MELDQLIFSSLCRNKKALSFRYEDMVIDNDQLTLIISPNQFSLLRKSATHAWMYGHNSLRYQTTLGRETKNQKIPMQGFGENLVHRDRRQTRDMTTDTDKGEFMDPNPAGVGLKIQILGHN